MCTDKIKVIFMSVLIYMELDLKNYESEGKPYAFYDVLPLSRALMCVGQISGVE